MPPIKHENNIFPLHRMNLQSCGRTFFSNIRLDSSFLPTSTLSFEAFQDGIIIEMPPSESTLSIFPPLSLFFYLFCHISLLNTFSYLIFLCAQSLIAISCLKVKYISYKLRFIFYLSLFSARLFLILLI